MRSYEQATPRMVGWVTVLGGVVTSTVIMGCRSGAKPGADAAPPPVLAVSARAPESARAKDDLWHRALDGDRVDLSRLADREGAGGLLEGLEEGGALALTALAALPLADDADLAYGRLAEILQQIDPAEATPVVAAARAIAQRPRRQVELLDPVGMRACGDALLAIARRVDLPATVRAPVISAARIFAELHGVDGDAIPRDLDAR